MMKQRTIASPVKTVGIGLHSGRKVTIVIKPAPVNSGVQFVRVDTEQQSLVPATALAVCDTRLASVIQKDGVRVSTVEHLLSACAGLGLDNLFIELDGEEVPIMDGSAASFLFLIESAGIVEQDAPRQFVVIKKPVEVRQGDKLARLEPFFGFKLDFTIDFKHPAVDKTGQRFVVDFAERYKTTPVQLSEDAKLLLMNYPFPGNVRELKNLAEQISVLSTQNILTANDIKNFLVGLNYSLN